MPTRQHNAQQGFSMVELLIVIVISTAVMGTIFSQLGNLQKIYRAEESKLDNTQEAREFVDGLLRDLHQAGYPNARMFAPGVLINPAQNDSRSAVGLVAVSPTDLWFEADLDGDGQVDSVRYTLVADPANPGNCPCSIERSQSPKVNGVAPMDQAVTYITALSGVVNSAGMGGSGTGGSLPIGGTTIVAGTTGNRTTANDVLYAAYKMPAVFSAFDQDGNAISLPANIDSSASTLATVRTIRITVNAIGNTPNLQDGSRPVVTITATARLLN